MRSLWYVVDKLCLWAQPHTHMAVDGSLRYTPLCRFVHERPLGPRPMCTSNQTIHRQLVQLMKSDFDEYCAKAPMLLDDHDDDDNAAKRTRTTQHDEDAWVAFLKDMKNILFGHKKGVSVHKQILQNAKKHKLPLPSKQSVRRRFHAVIPRPQPKHTAVLSGGNKKKGQRRRKHHCVITSRRRGTLVVSALLV